MALSHNGHVHAPHRLVILGSLLFLAVGLSACSVSEDALKGSLLPGETLPSVTDVAFTPRSPLLRWIAEGEGPFHGEDESMFKELFNTYHSIPEFLADVRVLVEEKEGPSVLGQTLSLGGGVTLSLADPREGGVLIKSPRLMVTEALLKDPTAHPKFRTIRRLAITDKTTGEEIYSEEHLPGQLLAGCRGEACAMLENAFVGGAVFLQSDGIRVARKVNDGLYVLESSDPEARPEAMMANPAFAAFLRTEGNYLEPNGIFRTLATPNDPDFGKLWGLHNTGQDLPTSRSFDVPNGDGITDINAPEAWDIWTGDDNVLICVIDTGINYTIPDLAPNIWTNPGEIPGDGIDNDENGFIDDVHGYDFINNDGDPMDDNNHGTHVSGTIGAVGNNDLGITGVMWNAKIMGLKFLSGGGSGSLEDAVRAIDYATQMGCSLTSNSWGGGGFLQSMYDAIQRADAAGILFVAAAGNNGADSDQSPAYPAAYDLSNIISVAAIDAQGRLASFSNWGATTVDLGAPGVQVLSYVLDGSTQYFAGTSMAAPHVSGVVGLMRSLNPQFPHNSIRDLLFLTVTPTESLAGKTWTGGRANALGALEVIVSGFFPVLTEPVVPDDGFLSPGETVDLPLELTNGGYKAGADIRVNVEAFDQKVTIMTPMPILYGRMDPNVPVTKTLRIAIAADISTPADVTFTLDISASVDGESKDFVRNFKKPIYTVGTISGTVTNERFATPIEGANISYEGTISNTEPPRDLMGKTASNAAGEYVLSLPLGMYTLLANAQGLLRSEPVEITLPPDRVIDWQLGAPELEASPLSFSFTVDQGSASTQILSVSNEQGSTALTFEIPTVTGSVMLLRSLTHEFFPGRGVVWDGLNLWLVRNFARSKEGPSASPARLMKVHPQTGNTLEEIVTWNPACTEETNRRWLYGLAWDGQDIWAMEVIGAAGADGCYSANGPRTVSAVRIDPTTGEILNRIVVPSLSSEAQPITWFGERALLLVRISGKERLIEVDPEEGITRVGPPIPDEFADTLDHQIGGIAWDGKSLWVSDTRMGGEHRSDRLLQLHQFAIGDDLGMTHLLSVDLTELYVGGAPPFLTDLTMEDNITWLHVAGPLFPYRTPTTDILFSPAFQPWLSADPTEGAILYGERRDVDVTTDASTLEVGTYEGNLPLLTNDLDALITFLPVSLTVTSVPPVVSDIPDQTIIEGNTFTPISLDDYVTDPNNADSDITWTTSGNTDLTLTIDVNRIATITTPDPDWNGTEIITFTATDPDGFSDSDPATFEVTAVNDQPTVSGIPDQTVSEGDLFTPIILDNFVTDPDNTPDEMTWSVTGNTELTVVLFPGNFVIITAPPGWTGTETITFTATDPGDLSGSDQAVFTVGTPLPDLCLSTTLQHRTRKSKTHELSSAFLTITDQATGTIVKSASLPIAAQGEIHLTDITGINDDATTLYTLTLKPRGHLGRILTDQTDLFTGCTGMGEALPGDFDEDEDIDLPDIVTAINYYINRETSPFADLFQDIYRYSFDLPDLVELIRNSIQTR